MTASEIERKADEYLSKKHAHLSSEDFWFRWSTLCSKMQEALNDGVITEDEFEKVKADAGEHWTWARNS
jgi:hypothetical protein